MPAPSAATRWVHQYTREPKHGPLPALLLMLTVTTGLVDAVSILSLGRVFVANMTGNVVFIAFGLAGVPGFSVIASLVALVAFLAGAGLAGVIVRQHGRHRAHLLHRVAWGEFVLLLIAALVLVAGPREPSTLAQVAAVAAAGLALGGQNAVARSLAVPDLTTTVLTMTLTGIAADLHSGRVASRRLLSVAAMFLGALAGALLVQRVNPGWAMLGAAVLVGVVAALLSVSLRRGERPWHTVAAAG